MNRFRMACFSVRVLTQWLTRYLYGRLGTRSKPVHIIFCMIDAYEPGTGNVSADVEKERVQLLLSRYPELARRHLDSSGNVPKRTWFFPPHYHRHGTLQSLASLCAGGYGEIELHLHHGKTRPDQSDNLERTIRKTVEEYARFGIFGKEEGQTRYGFVHGDWALDNSRNGQYCGVNDEMQILRRTGCYADFTFPSRNESMPMKINSIYYAKDNPQKPKSHNRGKCVKRLAAPSGDLMIVQGPIHPYLLEGKLSRLRVIGDEICGAPVVDQQRVDWWVRTGIHVTGKRDWVIIKTHTHGAEAGDAVLGGEMDDIFTYLEATYKDESDFILHYVTARELYNIIKAVEAGEPGNDPEAYRNYRIQPPVYDPSPRISEASEQLKELVARTYPSSNTTSLQTGVPDT